MLQSLLDVLFGCPHKNYTFPMSNKHGNSEAGARTGTYVVCLDCGREFAYDWRQMKIVPDSGYKEAVGNNQPYANRAA